MQRVYAMYHCPCPDGGFAALAARMAIPYVICVPHNTTTTLEQEDAFLKKLQPQDTVYLLDFAGPRGFLSLLCTACTKVVLLDHHKTAQEELDSMEGVMPPNLKYIVDQTRSGAVLALDYFFSPDSVSTELARVFGYVQDHDLWRHELPESRAFSAGLRDMDLPWHALFDEPGHVPPVLKNMQVQATIARGRSVLAHNARIVSSELERVYPVLINGTWPCMAVDTDHSALCSDIGNAIARAYPQCVAACVCYTLDDGTHRISLRSIGTGPEADTTRISRAFGGGGHANASGCSIPRHVWETFFT